MNHESLEKYLGITTYHTEKIPLPPPRLSAQRTRSPCKQTASNETSYKPVRVSITASVNTRVLWDFFSIVLRLAITIHRRPLARKATEAIMPKVTLSSTGYPPLLEGIVEFDKVLRLFSFVISSSLLAPICTRKY